MHIAALEMDALSRADELLIFDARIASGRAETKKSITV
jgi:hypothetical protein